MVWSEKSTLGEIPFCFRRVSALGDFLRCSLAPLALLAGGTALDRSIDAILAALSQGPFIFNLGHGVLPETPVNMCVQLYKSNQPCKHYNKFSKNDLVRIRA